MKTNLAIMFADISGSTRIYETLGDSRARDITAKCVELMSKITQQYEGRVIKTIGDEVMCVFPSADTAGNAAIFMQESIQRSEADFGYPLRIRVGFHYGEVIEEQGDVFGDAVNLAARLAGQAKADQVITSGETCEYMHPLLKGKTRLLITTTVKGKQKSVKLYELTWGEEEDLTIMGSVSQIMTSVNPEVYLNVYYQNQEIQVNQGLSNITIGRGAQNHFMVSVAVASRLHARIEFRRGKFFIVDQSTNGTYVIMNGKVNFVHRDELPLEGQGKISLGKKFTGDEQQNNEYVLRFVVNGSLPQ